MSAPTNDRRIAAVRHELAQMALTAGVASEGLDRLEAWLPDLTREGRADECKRIREALVEARASFVRALALIRDIEKRKG